MCPLLADIRLRAEELGTHLPPGGQHLQVGLGLPTCVQCSTGPMGRMNRVELSVTTDPAGRRAVLIQFGDEGWVTLLPEDARDLAANLTAMAEQVEAG